MKVIFLDIDGVLNSMQYWESIQDKEEKLTEIIQMLGRTILKEEYER